MCFSLQNFNTEVIQVYPRWSLSGEVPRNKNGSVRDRRNGVKGSSNTSHFISKINAGKSRIWHKRGCVFPMVILLAFRNEQYRVNDHPYHAPQFTTTLKLNDEFLDRLKIDFHSNSESFYVGSASFRHRFQNGLSSELLISCLSRNCWWFK